MDILVGIDVGTTTCCALAMNAADGHVLALLGEPNSAAIQPSAAHPRRHELDVGRLGRLVEHLLGDLSQELGSQACEVRGIGVTGQQHGLALLDERLRPLRTAITWQDERLLERTPDGLENWLERFVRQVGGPEALWRCGCQPRSGYVGPLLYWLANQGALPQDARACFIPDAVVSHLSGTAPVCDATNGGGSALFDIVDGEWAWEAIARLRLPESLFPAVKPSAEPVGALRPELCERTGLPPGIPVGTSLGDNQASYLGSVARPSKDILINVGTGSQLSLAAERFCRLDDAEIETRALPDGRYLLVCAGLFGGRSYAYLRRFFAQVGRAFYGQQDAPSFEQLNAAAAAVPAGCQGVRCEPFFTGLRSQPDLRGCFAGLSPETLTPGHLTRALLEGMAEAFHGFYERMAQQVGPRGGLVGAGNGIRRNPLFADILAERFERPLRVPAQSEAGAWGAAALTGVRLGLLPDLDEIGALIAYRERLG